ncbi:MAG: DUF4339 domain-containing protein [Acidobacteria bacterium]|nr:DUF4339 domain-containing protein [Acidobacteriota bacterium]
MIRNTIRRDANLFRLVLRIDRPTVGFARKSSDRKIMDYLINSNGTQTGPFPEAEIVEGLQAGRFLPTDLGIVVGATDWKPLGEIFPVISSGGKGGCRTAIAWIAITIGVLVVIAGGGIVVLSFSANPEAGNSCKVAEREQAKVGQFYLILEARHLSNIDLRDQRKLAALSRDDRDLIDAFDNQRKTAASWSQVCGLDISSNRTRKIWGILLLIAGAFVSLFGFILRPRSKGLPSAS